MAPHRENHRAARSRELVGNLHPRGRRPDDENTTWPQLCRVAVVLCGDHVDRPEIAVADGGREVRGAVRSGRDHDVAGPPGAPVCDDPIQASRPGPRYVLDGRPLDDRGVERRCVAVEVVGEGVGGQVTVGIRAAIAEAGEAGHPVRGQQVERIPPLTAPPLPHSAAFEDDVLVACGRQQPAHGQPGMSGANDDGVYALHDNLAFFPMCRAGRAACSAGSAPFRAVSR
jgi:hypothetical protein